MTIKRFPDLSHQREDDNPAIQLCGRRFYKDQTEIEYLVEFLLVFLSPKYIADKNEKFGPGFPESKIIMAWPAKTTLKYIPEERLGLKLFAFLGSSKLETRHQCHKDRFEELLATLKQRIETDYNTSKDQILELLEQLLGGFVGVAANRSWCTQVFLPVGEGLVAGETIWEKVKGSKTPNISWKESFKKSLFSFSKHDFMARGGEILYLQLCNLIRFLDSPKLTTLEKQYGFESGSGHEALRTIEQGLQNLFQKTSPITQIVQWLEAADPETPEAVKEIRKDAKCGWCPEESWKEAYLFAQEFANICRATIDPMEKIEMLNFCCVFQVLRSICAQAVRYSTVMEDEQRELGGCNGFAWLLTPAQLDDAAFKETAKQNLVRVQEVIYGALKHPDIIPATPNKSGKTVNYDKKADEQSLGLLLSLGKRIGLIAPRTGAGARFVMSEKVLRFLVLALVAPGETMTLASFTDRMFYHYGMAVSGSPLKKAVNWTYPRQDFQIAALQKNWLEEALLAAGFLIPLSDAVSQVHNPFGENES